MSKIHYVPDPILENYPLGLPRLLHTLKNYLGDSYIPITVEQVIDRTLNDDEIKLSIYVTAKPCNVIHLILSEIGDSFNTKLTFFQKGKETRCTTTKELPYHNTLYLLKKSVMEHLLTDLVVELSREVGLFVNVPELNEEGY